MDGVPDELFDAWTAAVEREGERFGVLAQELDAGRTPVTGGLALPVPLTPGWTVADLIAHVGAVQRRATTAVRGAGADPGPSSRFPAPEGDLHGWYAIGLVELVAVLRSTDPDAPAWPLSPAAAGRARDWARRLASELLVHRLDVEDAAGLPAGPVDPALAADAVDELLTVLLPRWADRDPLATAGARVVVTATDLDRSWTVTIADGAVQVTPGGADSSDAQLAGLAEQLVRQVWGRPADVTTTGDPAAVALLRTQQ
jgi:uncharacterized protein (TIGR03083 family)